jgi:NADH-quinone oxidoreductase subunit F
VDPTSLPAYRADGGYRALERVLRIGRDQAIAEVTASGLVGRGGAAFPTGRKWSAVAAQPTQPHHLVCNADESEPGTFKDRVLIETDPFTLVEAMTIEAFAVGAARGFLYLRGEYPLAELRVGHAIAEARAAGLLGADILGSGFDFELELRRGAGAYICGEETALHDSLEGRRGQPRLKPPFPAVAGLYARPTVVNNVESIASVPSILLHGADWFSGMGTEKSTGFGIFSLSGHVTRPGQYEAPLGITLRELLDLAGGVREGHELKFWTPGGSSTPIFTAEHLDVPLDFESVAAAGSMLGTRALQIFDETTSVVRAVARWTDFYAHESCGKCTPCREGTFWLSQIMERLEHGRGSQDDIDKLVDICDNILGRAFCALGDGATSPITSAVQYFREEFEAGMHTPAAELFPPSRSTLFAKETVPS